ncbi:unnamed protein product [Adineta ricciae]|uniref:Uncharacterized protein n=1 Tax=Adineta ricciae TaxID=249248 RepID=A0A816DQS9_ADIRI|nr:unnamed protein product [Adineta ricciae]
MSDFLTLQQKVDLARGDFIRIAGSINGEISWDQCELLIKQYCPNASKTQIDGLLYDADQDGNFEPCLYLYSYHQKKYHLGTSTIHFDGFLTAILYFFETKVDQHGSTLPDVEQQQQRLNDFVQKLFEMKTAGIIINDKIEELADQYNIPHQ